MVHDGAAHLVQLILDEDVHQLQQPVLVHYIEPEFWQLNYSAVCELYYLCSKLLVHIEVLLVAII